MTKEPLIEKIQALLKPDVGFDFLLVLKKSEIETLVASIRERLDREYYG